MKQVKFFLLAFTFATALSMQAQNEPIEDFHPNYVEVDLSQDAVFLSQETALDSALLTDFLKRYVPNIPTGYYFSIVRANEDVKGFEHLDCAQYSLSDDAHIDGRELIIHTDANTGKVLLITGDLYVPNKDSKTTKKPKFKVTQKGDLVTIFVKGKEHTCTIKHTPKAKIYIDTTTGEEV